MLDLFRILIVVFIAMHGIGHVIWFLASWTPVPTGFKDGTWVLPGGITIRSPVGKFWGLAALVVVGLFAAGAIGLLLAEPWWTGPTNLGVFLSFGVVVPWWRQAPGSSALYAIIANLVLMFLMALDSSDVIELT